MTGLADLSPVHWAITLGVTAAWLWLMLALSPAADWIASRVVAKPPNLSMFAGLQQSTAKLVGGILLAWAVGGVLEEYLLRGLLLEWIRASLPAGLPELARTAAAILGAASVGGVAHLYQGPRAAIIAGQLSALFGLLYVITGHNLVAVILCHGGYDTVAFIRFARRQSKYSAV
jgi:hypothetical protein